jgi:hypothetical protein
MGIWLLDATSTRSLEIGESPLLAFTTSAWRIRPEEVSRLAASQEKVRLSRTEGPRIRGSTEIEILRGYIQAFSRPARPISRLTSNLRKMKTTARAPAIFSRYPCMALNNA